MTREAGEEDRRWWHGTFSVEEIGRVRELDPAELDGFTGWARGLGWGHGCGCVSSGSLEKEENLLGYMPVEGELVEWLGEEGISPDADVFFVAERGGIRGPLSLVSQRFFMGSDAVAGATDRTWLLGLCHEPIYTFGFVPVVGGGDPPARHVS